MKGLVRFLVILTSLSLLVPTGYLGWNAYQIHQLRVLYKQCSIKRVSVTPLDVEPAITDEGVYRRCLEYQICLPWGQPIEEQTFHDATQLTQSGSGEEFAMERCSPTVNLLKAAHSQPNFQSDYDFYTAVFSETPDDLRMSSKQREINRVRDLLFTKEATLQIVSSIHAFEHKGIRGFLMDERGNHSMAVMFDREGKETFRLIFTHRGESYWAPSEINVVLRSLAESMATGKPATASPVATPSAP